MASAEVARNFREVARSGAARGGNFTEVAASMPALGGNFTEVASGAAGEGAVERRGEVAAQLGTIPARRARIGAVAAPCVRL